MTRKDKKEPDYQNIRLSLETHKDLQKYIVELVGSEQTPRISFDKAVRTLLKEHYDKGGDK